MATLSISQAWNETAAFIRRESGLILPIAFLLLAVPSAALQLAMPTPQAPGQTPEAGAWLILLPIVMIASIVGTIAISYLALRPGASVGEGLQVGTRRFIPVFLASLIIGLAAILVMVPLFLIAGLGSVASGTPPSGGAVALFILFFLVIGLVFWVRLMLITPVAAVEKAGPIEIIKRSWGLTRGHFWRLLGLVLLLMVVFIVVMVALSAIIGIFVFMLAGRPEPGSTSQILMTIISGLLSAAFSAVFITMIARVYAQLAESTPTEIFA
jgi:ABC-type Fe3+ transport system permease subunit